MLKIVRVLTIGLTLLGDIKSLIGQIPIGRRETSNNIFRLNRLICIYKSA